MPDVSIRPITYDDTEKIIKWRNSESVNKRFIYRGMFTKESHENWMKTMVETGIVDQFIIVYDQKDVGSVYLRDIDTDKGEAEYGIFIGEESARGCGVGTSAAELILNHAFYKRNLNTVFLRVLKDNKGALRSYEKAGFCPLDREEIIEIEGAKETVVFMSISREDFERRQK